MAVKKGGLGKGLDSLIPSGAPKNKKNITEERVIRIYQTVWCFATTAGSEKG